MGQLGNGNNRPGELGNTGQIILTRCDSGTCDCLAEEENKKKIIIAAAAPPTTAKPATSPFSRTRGSGSLVSIRRTPTRNKYQPAEKSQISQESLQTRYSRTEIQIWQRTLLKCLINYLL
jgi:hypothetical protein